jgi:insecticidal toxin complex protein TccC
VINNQPPDEDAIAAAFDDNGNLLALQAGQVLSWDLRNQLQEVRPVVRESGIDDSERYIYDASGQRMRKVRTTQAKAVTHIAEVRYLPGLEIRTDSATGESLRVITAQAGRNGVRVLHWQAGNPPELSDDQVRYSLTDHLGSSSLELDAQAQIISQESYYPFGGTSWWAGRNAVEASYKTVRYSGKERDATGLYYYGFRYYAPWLQRWINPDPAGAVDGLNLFCFVRNKPCSGFDSDGRGYKGLNDRHEKHVENSGRTIKYRGIKEMQKAGEDQLVSAIDVAIAESISMMKSEVERLKNNDVARLFKFISLQVPEELDSSKSYLRYVIYGYEKLIKRMSLHQAGGELREQLVFVGKRQEEEGAFETETIAFVNKGDKLKRIFITPRFKEMNPTAKIRALIHEASHHELETTDDLYYPGFMVQNVLQLEHVNTVLESDINMAIQTNFGMGIIHETAKHGGRSFRAWLTTIADFWAVYIVSQITPEKNATLHSQFRGHSEVTGSAVNKASSSRLFKWRK